MTEQDGVLSQTERTAGAEAIDAAVSAAAAAAVGISDDTQVWDILFDHGLAWVDFPRDCGGLEVPSSLRGYAREQVASAGLSQPDPGRNSIGFGMAADSA